MTVFQIIAILISLTAIFSYLNLRYFKLPATISVMLIALLMSLALIGVGHFAPWIQEAAVGLIRQIDFNDALMQGMLCFLSPRKYLRARHHPRSMPYGYGF